MTDISLILAILLGMVISFFVLVKPLFLEKPSPYFTPETDSQDFNEAVSLLEIISELDADLQMGKASKEDYESLSLDYRHRYLNAKSDAD